MILFSIWNTLKLAYDNVEVKHSSGQTPIYQLGSKNAANNGVGREKRTERKKGVVDEQDDLYIHSVICISPSGRALIFG